MTTFSEAIYSPSEVYYPQTSSEVRCLAGHIVFEGMAERWANNPDFRLVYDVEEQIAWLRGDGHGITPNELIAELSAEVKK
jgi:hypothetical protein